MSGPSGMLRNSADDLPTDPSMRENYNNVIHGGGRAPLRPMARPSPLSGSRPGNLLPREGWVVARGQAHLCGVSRSNRMPELRPSSRRAIRGVGRDERAGAPEAEAHGLLSA